MRFAYRLVITTDGREDLLDRTLESFDQHVRPRPSEVVVVNDSADEGYHSFLRSLCMEMSTRDQIPWKLHTHGEREGFCSTAQHAWQLAAAEPGPGFVFWLEDDFVFTRAVPLVDLAYVLERQPNVAQMALMRDAVNAAEIRAGGLYEHRRDEMTRRGSGTVAWLEHGSYWTTNPSLFLRSIAVEHRWPNVPNCEGEFTISLREARPGTTFGAWGVGEPWVKHIGRRSGVGY